MAIIDLNSGSQSEHIAKAAAALKDGYVIVVPLENSYALVADAFFHDAVRSLHVLRGDALGVAAQVLISTPASIDGIAREVSDDARSLMEKFWIFRFSLTVIYFLLIHSLSDEVMRQLRSSTIGLRLLFELLLFFFNW